MADRAFLERLTRELSDEGKLIEAGWVSLRIAAINSTADADQLREMRMAFFAGAQHLFSSIMTIMDEDAEPTDKDMQRLEQIDAELARFGDELRLRITPTEGST